METRLSPIMTHYVAIIEDAGPDHAVGVWFPDLPGCTSAGDDIDEALRNAPEALELFAEGVKEGGQSLPRPRTLTELRADPAVAEDLKNMTPEEAKAEAAAAPSNGQGAHVPPVVAAARAMNAPRK